MRKYRIFVATAIVVLLGGVGADLCAKGSHEIQGNWFCQPVQAIQYSNVGTSGTYNQITYMNSSDGVCSSQPKQFSGPLSPLDEEVSLHLRGPIQLKQLAIYTPSSPKYVNRRDTTVHQHAHQHVGNNIRAKGRLHGWKKRQTVTAKIDGKPVTWENNWSGIPSPAPSSCVPPTEVTATINGKPETWANYWYGGDPAHTCVPAPAPETASHPDAQPPTTANVKPDPPLTSAKSTSASSAPLSASKVVPTSPAGPSIDNGQVYDRIGYYDSVSQTVDNLVFLGNYGGQSSGVFDSFFGNSLAFVNSTGTGGASSPQILADTTIPSDSEIIVMLGETCGANDCGYVRPGSVAYHGIDGAEKVILMEYSMPMDGNTGFNGDMPSIWMLNAQIPRTLQYGNALCSCWESGCGEFDIAETLFQGSTYLKSTLHTNTPGGDSDYLERPISGTMKLAVIFNSSSSTIHIQVLPNDTVFSPSLAASDINGMCQETASNLISYFTVA